MENKQEIRLLIREYINTLVEDKFIEEKKSKTPESNIDKEAIIVVDELDYNNQNSEQAK